MIVSSPDKATNLIRAMVVLHNYLRSVSDNAYSPPGYADIANSNGDVTPGFWRSEHSMELPNVIQSSRSTSTQAIDVRDQLVQYFSDASSVEWQEAYINRQ